MPDNDNEVPGRSAASMLCPFSVPLDSPLWFACPSPFPYRSRGRLASIFLG